MLNRVKTIGKTQSKCRQGYSATRMEAITSTARRHSMGTITNLSRFLQMNGEQRTLIM